MTNHRPHPLDQVEVRFALAGAVLVLVLLGARLAGLADGYVFGLLLFATTAGAATLSRGLALLLGLTAWALCTGFVTHSYGVLTFHHADLVLLAELVAAAVLVSHLAGVARTVAHADRRRAAVRVHGRPA